MKTESPSLSTPEPSPTAAEGAAIWSLVIKDMCDRHASGVAKYGVPLQAGNGRNPLVDAYQELLDQLAYMRQCIEERAAMLREIEQLRSKEAQLMMEIERLRLMAAPIAGTTGQETSPGSEAKAGGQDGADASGMGFIADPCNRKRVQDLGFLVASGRPGAVDGVNA